ncbi:hypothetical protein OGM63_18355 [Plectonema radiosum NIES-515]|jgi:hypothetical protein|uniref:Uncharacterized protein n=1 Tax=Plectonema radiosum NIES-515 TaxID=2986073 RepID=A0ABT3B241_9CYAN|nr:hypothetical protein [Plectonema radiosum]MCV3215451.1 hypothetical protein [Plectonema radiosum NIES-515]
MVQKTAITDIFKSLAEVESRFHLFGIMTNGDGIIFVKLTQQDTPQYDISRVFSPAPLGNELYTVLQIFKRIGQIIVSS